MEIDTTIEVTQYRNLNDGDIFQASTQHGVSFIGMKVATRQTRDDTPSHDVLVFYPDKPPAIFNAASIGNKGVVGKLKNVSFSVSHRQSADLILDLKSDIRARTGAGCVYIHGDDYFLGAVWREQGAEAENLFVNIKTGECWHDAQVGTWGGSSHVNLLTGGVGVVLGWQIAEMTSEKKIWVSYDVRGAPTSNAA